MKNPWHFLRTSWLQLILLPSLITVFFSARLHSWFVESSRCCAVKMSQVCLGLQRICKFLCVGAFQKSKYWDGTGVKHFHHTCAHLYVLKVQYVHYTVCTLYLAQQLHNAGALYDCLPEGETSRKHLQAFFSGPRVTNITDLLRLSSSYIFISFGRAHLDISCFVDR